MTDVIRTKEEIEERLEQLREYEHVSAEDYHANQAAIRQLEWVISPNEAEENDPTNTDN